MSHNPPLQTPPVGAFTVTPTVFELFVGFGSVSAPLTEAVSVIAWATCGAVRLTTTVYWPH